ncbi:MOSC domain-containing protein [Arthrobacter castelli]|uniref:MOSC domain-containing protein n=1 Tax=Arthrobacter castelli TaxID=271431 RepID=UPI0004087496|nr:MOSC domain-containing protein [Arthrobacter castelli]
MPDSAPRLVTICRVHQLQPVSGAPGVTAIDKRPAEGPVKVHKLGLYGDVQADRKHHGGEDKALYAYSAEEAAHWEAKLGRGVPPGYFGENLRTRGVETTGAVIGERWRIGQGVEVEVTMPRIPCANFATHTGEARWVKRFTEEALVGAYLRVVATGALEAGDDIEVIHRPEHGITVGRWFAGSDPADAQSLIDADAAGEFTMAASLRSYVDKALRRVAGRAAVRGVESR